MAEHQELLIAIEAVRDAPDEAANWDRVEALVDEAQRPTDVSELFRSVLTPEMSAELVTDIGQRAVRFYESWYGEESQGLPETLERVLEIDPNAHWAFERLTVAYTVAEKWDALLSAYDKAIAAANDTTRRMQLLDEAAQAAKDFAGQPDRAIGFMTQLIALDPSNTTLAASLERLLERQERWQDLVTLYEGRVGVQTKAQARDTRLRMAACYLERLSDAANALVTAKEVLAQAPEYKPARDMVEQVLAQAEAPAEIRSEALSLLKEHYLKANAPKDVVRVLETSLEFAVDDARRTTLRELVSRLVDLSDDVRAMTHQAGLLVLEPMPQEREALFVLSTRTRNFELYQQALVDAAEALRDRSRLDLLMEAGRALEQELGDGARAIDCYRRVFDAPDAEELSVASGRRLMELLGQTDREAETLEVFARMTHLEPDPDRRRRQLGEVARLSEKLGDGQRAGDAWRARLADDPEDVEALDALVEKTKVAEAWGDLAPLLRQRAQAKGAADRRREDLVWLARLQSERLEDLDGAIATWREIQAGFGEDQETVNALTDLLSRAERWPELAQVLQQAAEREIARFTELQAQLGDAFRLQLGRPEEAVLRYRSALQVDPHHELARAGQHALLENAECRAAAAESLAEAYAQTDEWQPLLGLLEVRLLAEDSEAGRAELLVEAAEMHENRGEDLDAALKCYRRAFALLPDDRGTEREIRRLAEALGRWEAVVEAYRETISSLPSDSPRGAELRYQEGQVLEQRLEQSEAALVAYTGAVAVSPKRSEFGVAAVRQACDLARYNEAAGNMLKCMAAQDCFATDICDEVEAHAVRADAWPAVAEATFSALQQGEQALSPALRRELFARVAHWQAEHVDDPAAAELALVSAAAAEPEHLQTLQALAALQRRSPGAALVETLLRIAGLEASNLDALAEAASVTVEHTELAEQAMTIVERLYAAATALFKQHREATGERDAQSTVVWSLEHLLRLRREAGSPAAALELLTEAITLPFDAEAVQELRHKAASLAKDEVGDRQRAIELYRDVLHMDPRDGVATRELAALYQAGDRLPELLMLRHHELDLEPADARRLELRLEIAAVLGEMEARGGRLQSLEANLEQQPGHRESTQALSRLMRDKGQHAELAAMIEAQAKRVARAGDGERAIELWTEAAALFETELADPNSAIVAYESLHALAPNGPASAALARLHAGRGEHGKAAEWLELRLGTAPPEERTATALELARAHLEAGHADRARGCLEQASAQDPDAHDARDLLARLYREEGRYEPLTRLLSAGAERAGDAQRKLAYLTEVAELFHNQLRSPERALPALDLAREIAPDDPRLSLMRAKSLHAAGRYDEAAALLQDLIQGFGRKRSPERAELHFQLARVLAEGGDEAAALSELETATKMDLAHAAALHMSAELSRKAKDLDRAERAYRGLLMLVRRKQPVEIEDIGISEVFFALYQIAVERGQTEQANELLQSAREVGKQSDQEAQRLQRAALAAGDVDNVLFALDARAELVSEPAAEAEVVAARAEALERHLERPDEAFRARLRAVELDPDNDAWHGAAREQAVRLDALQRYLDSCDSLAHDALLDGGAGPGLAAKLLLRMGETIEQELGDLDRAAGLYAKAEATGQHVVGAWLAMARVAGARGEAAEQRRVLARISQLDDAQASQEDRNRALFMVAELDLSGEGTLDSGLAALEQALDDSPDYDRAYQLVQRALVADAAQPRALSLLERIARAKADDKMLLDWHCRVSLGSDVDPSSVRAGIDLALRMSDLAVAEQLLQRAAELARASGEMEGRAWIFSGLAECRMQAGDVAAAIRYMDEALGYATGDEERDLRVELAQLASREGGDLDVAARAYEGLLDAAPGDRALWEPLLEVYARIGDRERYEGFVARVLQELLPEEDRAFLMLNHARFLVSERAESDAAPVLRALIDEQPGNIEATDLLTALYERNGMNQELAALLGEQFDQARDREDADAVSELGLRLGQLYGPEQSDVAIDIYRAALEWAPEHSGVLRALLARMEGEAEPRERGEVIQTVLRVDPAQDAAALAREAVSIWRSLGDAEMLQSALELGRQACPDDQELGVWLEAFYAENGLFEPLAQLMMADAERMGEGPEAVVRYKNAASLYREQLQDVDGASGALRAALAIVPDDLSLLGELARNLAAAGQHQTAIDDVTRLLEQHAGQDTGRVDLLRVRADLYRSVEQLDDALKDYEEAYAIAPADVAPALLAVLEMATERAAGSGDTEQQRRRFMQMVEVLDAMGDSERARDMLAGWASGHTDDIGALRLLRQRDEGAERWDDVAATCERLTIVEEAESRAEAALGLADACARAGRPQDARAGLERVYADMPDNALVRGRLRDLYEAAGAHAELAEILIRDAADRDEVSDRVSTYQRAAALYIGAERPEAALVPLQQARELNPEDRESILLMIDIHTKLGDISAAGAMLEEAIAGHKRKRSPELAKLQQRMARLKLSEGDTAAQLEWLNQALDTDRKSAAIAAELAESALAVEDYDSAMKALRSITMMEDPQPITRAMAFLKQAQIAVVRGDVRRAQHWARKAKSLDPGLSEAETFLAEIGG